MSSTEDVQNSESQVGEAPSKTSNPVADKAAQLLEQAESALNQLDDKASARTPAAQTFQLEDLVGTEGPPEKCSIDLLRDFDLDLKIEL